MNLVWLNSGMVWLIWEKYVLMMGRIFFSGGRLGEEVWMMDLFGLEVVVEFVLGLDVLVDELGIGRVLCILMVLLKLFFLLLDMVIIFDLGI